MEYLYRAMVPASLSKKQATAGRYSAFSKQIKLRVNPMRSLPLALGVFLWFSIPLSTLHQHACLPRLLYGTTNTPARVLRPTSGLVGKKMPAPEFRSSVHNEKPTEDSDSAVESTSPPFSSPRFTTTRSLREHSGKINRSAGVHEASIMQQAARNDTSWRKRILGTTKIMVPSQKGPGLAATIHLTTTREGVETAKTESNGDSPDAYEVHVGARIQHKSGEVLDILEGIKMKGIDKTQSVAPDAFARTGKQGGTAVSDSSAAPGDTRFQTNSYRSWVPNPEDMIDNEAFGIARNAFYESKLEMPHPLIPVNGTGFQPEPVLPEYMYPHEVRCPAGWLAYGPHCITIVAVPVWTTCPGDRSFKRHGLRSRMAVASPGICAVTRETGVSLVCPGGYEPHFSEVLAFTPNDVENGKTGKSNEPIGRAFTCTQLDSIPIAVAAGDHCPPGYSISDVGTCEARKQVGPSVSCPEGFVLGGEQTSPYAILSQEFAKCGAVEYYLGKVWCPDGFLPLGIDLPNLPFGSSLDAFGTVDRIAQAAEANRLSPSPRSLKRMEDTNSLQRKKAKIHKVASELRSVFPDSFVDVLLQNTLSEMHVEAETNPLDEEEMQQEGSWKEDAKSEGHRTDQGMDELEIGETLSDDMEEDLNEDVWIVDDTEAEMEVDYELADNFDFQLKADSQRSPTNEASLQTQGRQSATEGSPISKLNSEAIPSSLASFEETTIKQAQARGTTPAVHPHRNVSSESQQGTGETLNRDGETGGHSGRKRRSEVRRKRRMQEQRKTSEGVQATPNLIMQLEAKIPPGGACVHIVGVFEGHCDKIECHGGIMKKIHQLVYDWVDYRLRVDIRQVDMFIPNGRDFRRTTPG